MPGGLAAEGKAEGVRVASGRRSLPSEGIPRGWRGGGRPSSTLGASAKEAEVQTAGEKVQSPPPRHCETRKGRDERQVRLKIEGR